ncbi:MAG: hypothetical protein EP330_05395 [Deltaproteobacteria bacterium]|nr:MAG: hypothetical protein EP330_05395 [Deltaproteobacteria bacterium]
MLVLLAALAQATPAIDAHLAEVEADLRAADTDGLDAEARAHRARLLDVLHDYRVAGQYPENEVSRVGRTRPKPFPAGFPEAPGRTPVFVDEHGTHCAVGYLLAVDGEDALVARIAATDNLAYVHELADPDLLDWADARGFTVDELARIQPAYDFEEDNDGDGWTSNSDCDDNDKHVNPDADEVCANAVDDDCDGTIDESTCVDKGCNSGDADGTALLLLAPLALFFRRRA